MKVRVIQNVRGKLNWCCLRLGWTSYITLEFFRFESGLFGLMMDKSWVIDVILGHELNRCGLGLEYTKFLSVWLLGSQLILFWFRFRMDQGSFIWVIEETNAKGFFRTGMDIGSIIFVIWARNYIGVA